MDSFYRVAKNMVNVPLLAYLYDDARDGQVMDEVVFFEMALSLGKIAAAFIGAAIFAYLPSPWTFVFCLAAGFTALFAVMPERA
jgi:hypothetical protein